MGIGPFDSPLIVSKLIRSIFDTYCYAGSQSVSPRTSSDPDAMPITANRAYLCNYGFGASLVYDTRMWIIKSLVFAGLSQLDAGSFGRIGVRALLYYVTTTCCAVIIGICCVLAIHPGDPSIKGELGEGVEPRKVTTLDAFLDLVRSVTRSRP